MGLYWDNMKVFGLIVAAGSSQRFRGATPKQFHQLCNRPILSWTIARLEAASSIDGIVVVVAEDQLLYTSQTVIDPYGYTKVQKVVVGGETRQQSVLKGLEALPVSTDYVAIHDGARPLVKPTDIDRVVDVAVRDRAAILAIPATDTAKRVKDGFVLATLDRDSLYLAQTPQVFQYDLIIEAHRKAAAESKRVVTDDASLLESMGFVVRAVEPTAPNIKVTVREDLPLVEALLRRESDE